MNEFGRIDDPLEASFSAWPEEGDHEAGTALEIAGLLSPTIAVLKVVWDRFRTEKRLQRLNYFFDGVRLKIQELESKIAGTDGAINEIRQKLESSAFQEAADTAAEEAVRATNPEKIGQFVNVLIGSIDPTLLDDLPVDAASLIRTVVQLTNQDLHVLHSICESFDDVLKTHPNLNSGDAFTQRMINYRGVIAASGLHRDEFQSVCDRLRGLGLAAEVSRNTSRMSPDEYMYRPTRRGAKLLKMLGDSWSRSGNATASNG